MTVENAQYIPELVPTNPAGSDPVSEGDDHLRQTKLAVKQSFPAFVGTTASPKSVTLTEDQINDAARKSVANTFTGVNTYTETQRFNGPKLVIGDNGRIDGIDNSDTERRIVQLVKSVDEMRFGENALKMQYFGSVHEVNHAGTRVTDTATRDAGSLLIYDRAGSTRKVGFRNPNNTDVSSNTPAATQDWEGQIRRLTGSAPALSLPTLEKDTVLRFLFVNAGTVTNANMEWFGGNGVQTGNRNVAAGSVIEISYRSSTVPVIFGNGIS